jgi:hypothetical protein
VHFNRHSDMEGLHAFLSPSSYHWLRYDRDHLVERFRTKKAAQLGSELHDIAHRLIKLKIKLPGNGTTLNSFVNDVISLFMMSEQTLIYSGNCFGTADAIGLKRLRGHELPTLRVFDLKTGESEAKVDQLIVYCALFCLEYGYRPLELEYDLRIYQNDAIQQWTEETLVQIAGKDEPFMPIPLAVTYAMDKIVTWDKVLDELQLKEG